MIQYSLITLLALTSLGFAALYFRTLSASGRTNKKELSFRTLAAVAPAGIWRTNPAGEAVFVNSAWLEMTGLHDDEWAGAGWSHAIHPEDRERVLSQWKEAVSRKDIFREEWRWLRPDGSARWVTTLCAPEYAPNGEILGYVGINIDINRAKQLELDLKLARERAENAGSAKTNFLANMSHEIRTPMNSVIGFTELLLESDLDDSQRDKAQLIADSGRAMLRLLNDILDVAKIEAGHLRILNEATDLRQIIRNCIQLMEPIAIAKSVSVSMWVDDDVPDLIEMDHQRIRQIILNLVGNAVKFTETGGVDVEARVERSKAGDSIKISVIDSGIGISEDRLQSIFSPFAQAESDPSHAFGGTGLGLTISSELVKMMGGEIKAQSRLGLGSSFTVLLPLRLIKPDETEDNGADGVNMIPEDIRNCRVLIAEDHAINQQLIMAMVSSLEVKAELVSNGREAVDAVVRADEDGMPFQMILMDMQMPEMDGLEATRRLRDIGYTSRQLPIIALTANCYPDDIAACRHAGMQAHLGKPITLVDLAKEMSKLLKRNEMLSQREMETSNDIVAQEPASAGVMYDLERRYRSRKQLLLRQIEDCLTRSASEIDWDLITSELHKLAGVAANFGEPQLGEISRRLEHQIKQTPQPDLRRAALEREWEEFNQAA